MTEERSVRRKRNADAEACDKEIRLFALVAAIAIALPLVIWLLVRSLCDCEDPAAVVILREWKRTRLL